MTTDDIEDAIFKAWLASDDATGRELAHRGLAEIAAKAASALLSASPRMPGREEAVRTACAFEWPHDERGACIVTEPVLARLVDAILALSPAREEWQPIETAPKNSKELLLCVAGFSPLTGHWHQSKGHWVSHPDHTYFDPTHWAPTPRPLPAPPSSDGGER